MFDKMLRTFIDRDEESAYLNREYLSERFLSF